VADGRLITKGVSISDKLPELSPDSLNLFFLLIPHFTGHGKMNGDPHYIKGEVVPKFKRFTVPRIQKCLLEINEKTNVQWFSEDGLLYLHALNFKEHQPNLRQDRMGADKLPTYSRQTPNLLPIKSRTNIKIKIKIKKEAAEKAEAKPALSEELKKEIAEKINKFKMLSGDNGNSFDAGAFLGKNIKAEIPPEVTNYVLGELLKHKGEVKNLWGYAITILKKEYGNFFYAQRLAEHIALKEEFLKIKTDGILDKFRREDNVKY